MTHANTSPRPRYHRKSSTGYEGQKGGFNMGPIGPISKARGIRCLEFGLYLLSQTPRREAVMCGKLLVSRCIQPIYTSCQKVTVKLSSETQECVAKREACNSPRVDSDGVVCVCALVRLPVGLVLYTRDCHSSGRSPVQSVGLSRDPAVGRFVGPSQG